MLNFSDPVYVNAMKRTDRMCDSINMLRSACVSISVKRSTQKSFSGANL